jgi:SAM-dependent methyltransferase
MRITTAHRSAHVGSDDLIDCRARCPICGHDGPRKPIVRLQRDPDIHLLACALCRGSSASYMPAAAYLERYYGGYHDGRNAAVTFSDAGRFARRVVASLPEKSTGRTFRLLDFGGGDGTLAVAIARRLRESNVEITVVDWGRPVDPGDARIRIESCPAIDGAAGTYDLVLASAVLEHVPDLHSLLPALAAKMRSGGFLYARTPYVVPLRKLLPLDVGFPAHVHDLGSSFWLTLTKWFPSPMRTVVSRPSPVAASWRHEPLRALAAHILKAPAHVNRSWPFVGGWEVLLERPS